MVTSSVHPVAQLYPPEIRDALVGCARVRDVATIDRLTDELVRRGFCRPRVDMRTAEELAAALARSRGLSA